MTENYTISEQDIPSNMTLAAVFEQLQDFKNGFPCTEITSAATDGNGITALEQILCQDTPESDCTNLKIVKFVPASGAATRMFKDLFEYLSTGTMNTTTQTVLNNLEKFAFYNDLQQTLPTNPTDRDIIECLVTPRGLNYGNLPKGLLKFHKHNGETHTAVAEHLAEGAQYASSNGCVNIHFTVSPEHISGFTTLLDTLVPEQEQSTGMKYNISLSTQKPETNTIAVNPDNTPFYNDDGTFLFRPSGHGALLENLNDIDADIIFIKNIDNVCPANRRADTIKSKKALLSIGLKIQRKIFEYIRALDQGTANEQKISDFITTHLGIRNFSTSSLREILNRPLRICGMVLNTGAPGGGPFWVRGTDGTETLQIVEPNQISPEKISILHTGQYFNPVDLVCFVRDYMGNKFDLSKFIDPKTGFISDKSHNGRPLRAMERPGLWNGAMAKWNTVFIPVPASTFTPAKVVTDLIKPQHQ